MNRRRFVASLGALTAIVGFAPIVHADAKAMQVYRSPSCGCCSAWAAHIKRAGIDVVIHNTEELDRLKTMAGLPETLWSCHTAFIGGYTIEGHVPVREVKRLLVERPKAKGLAVPGMPTGSPGMAMGDQRDPYKVMLYGKGWSRPFASYS